MLVRSSFCLPSEHHINGALKSGRNSSPGKSGLQLCSECNRLNSLGMSLLVDLTSSAESGYGEGELAYGLLKGEESSRISISLSLPFIIREKRILRKLLMSCNGFAVLLDILRAHGSATGVFPASVEPNEKIQKEDNKCLLSAAVDGLSYLANTLGISFNRKSTPKAVYESTSSCINLGEMKSNETTSENMQERYVNHNADEVIFSLDDGSMVNVSRENVSSISPVFRAMLQGNFLESKEGNLIKLPGVSHFCLNHILHHLGECPNINCLNISNCSKISSINDSKPSTESYGSCHWAKKPKEMYSALELVSISDRFLLPDTFRKRVADQVLDWYLCPQSAAKIYMWCIGSEGINGSRAPEDLGLLEGTLKFMLVGDMALSERVDLIKSVFEAGFGEELLSDVNDVIRMFIEP
ncbi:hypothetical protein J437_LFUL010760 [Ladona fulva]|uniref:BTB domain-containing protein n=1 Tax=Ladona fulva TaxID=123851 RepID=A0A8K0KE33_LADFU|nr:hypothetical protein J437_LFUL010760 [Ladona fulva]